MNSILMAVIGLLDTVVTYSIGAALITLGVAGIISGCRWLLNEGDVRHAGRAATLFRRGSGSLALVGVLAVGSAAVLAGLSFWSR